MDVPPIITKAEVDVWAQYPPGTDMVAALIEQRELGNPVLEVDYDRFAILIAHKEEGEG